MIVGNERLVNERGAVLVAALLVLATIAVIAVTVATTTVIEKAVTVNHRVASRSLYAADSGVEAAKQQMADYAQGRLDSLNNEWAGNGPIISDVQNFFPTAGFIFSHSGNPSYTGTTRLTFEDSSLAGQSQTYNFRYTVAATGTHVGGARSVVSEGRLRVSATRGSFADYLIFTDTHLIPGGFDIWFHTSGYFDGRVHTNGKLRFAYFPTFEDQVTSVSPTATYYNNGRSRDLDSDFNGTRDVPNFYGGFNRSEPEIPLPQNSYSQERASLGGNPADTSPLSNSDRRSMLGLSPGGTPPPTGVYIPNSGGLITGGIYVSGDAKKMTLQVDAQGRQVYSITDASNQNYMITIDYAANTTTQTSPSNGTTVYSGTPKGVTYCRGNIDNLGGPTRSGNDVRPAVANEHQVSVVASQDITIQGDLAYADYANGNSILGIFTDGGDVVVGASAPDNLVVDAFVMASGNKKVFTVQNYSSGGYRGQVHLRGGMITNYYGAFGTFRRDGSMTGYGRDFRYDRRGLVPPYFPLTNRFTTDEPQPIVMVWRED